MAMAEPPSSLIIADRYYYNLCLKLLIDECIRRMCVLVQTDMVVANTYRAIG